MTEEEKRKERERIQEMAEHDEATAIVHSRRIGEAEAIAMVNEKATSALRSMGLTDEQIAEVLSDQASRTKPPVTKEDIMFFHELIEERKRTELDYMHRLE